MSKLAKLQIKLLSELSIDEIENIYCFSTFSKKNLNIQIENEKQKIISDPSIDDEDKSDLLFYLDEDSYTADQTEKLAEELMFIALYKKIEIRIKRIGKASNLFTPDEIKSFSYYKILIKAFTNQGINIKTLSYYDFFNELRLINNVIKHEGIVDKDLSSAFPIHILGSELNNLLDHFDRLKENQIKFVQELGDALLQKIP